MHVISLKTLREFWESHPDVEQTLKAWHAEAQIADWSSPEGIKRRYPSADFLSENRVVFNLKGNRYRLVVSDPLQYPYGLYSFHRHSCRI